ncbi:MAG: hypothetical protein LBT00_05610 [Spirochaetaceae bacterium]|jgi:hypothetical protein|nr:hypothetical protein [Spirochaetaceae bacterium]
MGRNAVAVIASEAKQSSAGCILWIASPTATVLPQARHGNYVAAALQ